MVFDYLFEGRLYWGKIWGSTLQCPWRLVLVTSLAPSLRSLVSLSVISDLCWQWCLRGSRSMYCILRYWGPGAKVLRLESGDESRCVWTLHPQILVPFSEAMELWEMRFCWMKTVARVRVGMGEIALGFCFLTQAFCFPRLQDVPCYAASPCYPRLSCLHPHSTPATVDCIPFSWKPAHTLPLTLLLSPGIWSEQWEEQRIQRLLVLVAGMVITWHTQKRWFLGN